VFGVCRAEELFEMSVVVTDLKYADKDFVYLSVLWKGYGICSRMPMTTSR
jgi:hypothetical protein